MPRRVARPARRVIPLLLVAASAFLVVTGVLRGEAGEVMQKAARICLECIGIG